MALGLTPVTILSNVTVASGASTVLGDTTATDGSALMTLGFEVVLTFHASAAAAGARLDVMSSADGTNYTTSPVFSEDIPGVGGATVRRAITVLLGHKYFKPQLVNLSGQSITAITITAEPQALS